MVAAAAELVIAAAIFENAFVCGGPAKAQRERMVAGGQSGATCPAVYTPGRPGAAIEKWIVTWPPGNETNGSPRPQGRCCSAMKSPVAPEEGIDWPFVICVVLLIATFVGDIVLPAATVRPLIEAASALGEEQPAAAALPKPPSLAWPILCATADIVVVSVSAWRLIQEREFGGRWLWLLAASAAGAFWSLLTIAVLSKAHGIVAKALGQL